VNKRSLVNTGNRVRDAWEVIYGINPVLEALKAERQILQEILIAEGKHTPSLQVLRQLARVKRIPVQIQPQEVLSKIARLGSTRSHRPVSRIPIFGLEGLLLGFGLSRVRGFIGFDSIEDPQIWAP